MKAIKSIQIFMGMIIFSRIVQLIPNSKYPLNKATVFSNTLTFISLLISLQTKDKSPIAVASNIAFAMMSAFWTIYITCGEKALYGKYQPTNYEVWVDHFAIPLTPIVLAYYYKAHKQKNIDDTIIIAFGWLLYTFITGTSYPILKNYDKTLNYSRLCILFIIFATTSLIFHNICCKLKVRNDET